MAREKVYRKLIQFAEMKKYWQVYLSAIQDAFADRARLAVYVLQDFIAPLVSILLWIGVYRFSGKTASGWELDRLISYYLMVAFLSLTLNHYIEFSIGFRDIKLGGLVKYLVKPVSYLGYVFAGSNGWKTVRFLFALLPYSLLIMFFKQYFNVSASLPSVASAALFAAIAYLMIFFYKFLLGISSFWVVENYGLVNFFWMIQTLLSGLLIPIDFFPNWIKTVTWFLPFRFFYYLPVKLIIERQGLGDYLPDLGVAVIWVILLGWISASLYRKGLKNFSDTRQ